MVWFFCKNSNGRCCVDSTVLAHVMTSLNERYDYGLDMFLLSVDEGISGYRDDSLDVICHNTSSRLSQHRIHVFAQLIDREKE